MEFPAWFFAVIFVVWIVDHAVLTRTINRLIRDDLEYRRILLRLLEQQKQLLRGAG